ncbi:MAG: ABC transporter substrate-binding protein, partial [Deltaproteobacteria bacterium]|nr:ABC transporter substrate-binding protein [Deltaproteobacteria bacterium]
MMKTSITSTTERRTQGLLRLARTATVVLVALASGFAAPGARAMTESEAGARAVVSETVDEVLAVLRDKSVPTEERIRSLEKIVYGRFDLYVMSRLVLARNWKRFSENQK